MQLIVDVDSSEPEELLQKLIDRLMANQLKGFLATKVFRHLSNRASQRFAAEGDDASGPWTELAYATGRIRMFRGFQPFHPINVRTGALRRHILNSFKVFGAGEGGAYLQMPGNQGTREMQSKIKVAQMGGFATQSNRATGPNRAAPPRPVLAMSNRDHDRIGNDLLDWIRAGVA